MGSQYKTVASYRSKMWLSRGKVLVRLFTLCNEVMLFLSEFPFNLSTRLCDSEWLQRLSYLTDIFWSLSGLNLPLPGTSVTVFSAYGKTEAKLKKKSSFENLVWRKITECFPTLHEFFVWIGNASFIRNLFRNNRTFPKSTNINHRIFPVS